MKTIGPGSLSNVGASDVIKLHSESKNAWTCNVTDWGPNLRDEVNQIASDLGEVDGLTC